MNDASKSMQNNGSYELPKIKRKSYNRQVPPEIRDEKPSENFTNLLQSILQIDPEKRCAITGTAKQKQRYAEENHNHDIRTYYFDTFQFLFTGIESD